MHGKVFLACALGGGIGALVALQMWQPLWWIGLLVGGLVGYLSYEFKEVCRAIPRAWRMTGETEVHVNWRQLWEAGVVILTITASLFLPLAVTMTLNEFGQLADPNAAAHTLLLLFLGTFTGLISAVFSLPSDASSTVIARSTNPLAIWGYHIPRLLWWTVKGLARGAVAAVVLSRSFTKYLFILIHSEVRLLCAFDAAFGAAIGYFAGHVLIGALAGGVIGVANFELISKRLLHLVPSR